MIQSRWQVKFYLLSRILLKFLIFFIEFVYNENANVHQAHEGLIEIGLFGHE